MSLKTIIQDGQGSGSKARVSKYGQLITAPLDYSTPVTITLDAINTAYNFVVPKSGHKIVITDIFLFANKNVGVGDATVDIYTSDIGPDSLTVKEIILETEMLRQSSRDLIGLNLAVEGEGRWLNAKTDDDDIFCTIAYYYVPLVEGS